LPNDVLTTFASFVQNKNQFVHGTKIGPNHLNPRESSKELLQQQKLLISRKYMGLKASP